ncbi:MAG: ATP-binding cassette domain-containing protein, partial [Bryocella sp.]
TTSADLGFDATDRQTKRLVEFDDVTLTLGERDIVRHVKFSISNGMKLGLVGPNGSGKTTILRAITGDLKASAGTIKRAATLRIVYFSQMRELDGTLTLRRALAPDSDAVVYQDRVVHVASYAAKFLFSGDQLNQPVERLSGGERARVLIARLMLQPADVLILDEPTNDLDIPTLEILEEALLEFRGALVLVTHDRYLLDRVANVVLGLDGRMNAQLFADYLQWEEWKGETENSGVKTGKTVGKTSAKSGGKKKLSYLEQREFDGIEVKVEAADVRMAAAHDALADPAVTSNGEALIGALAEMEAAQVEHDAVYERWAELTEKAGA